MTVRDGSDAAASRELAATVRFPAISRPIPACPLSARRAVLLLHGVDTRSWMYDESVAMVVLKYTLFAVMLCSSTLHVAPARAALHGEVTEYGETTAEQERPAQQTQDDHSLVPRTTIDGIRYVDHANSLPAQPCLRFGVTVRLSSDAGEQLPHQLIVVVTHPRITRPDQAFSTQDSFPTPVLHNLAYAGWTFDYPWEQQPGEWMVTFMNEREVVASKTFTITVPTSASSRCSPKSVS